MQSQGIVNLSHIDFQREIEAGQPVVVDFYADWCPPCKIVSPILENLAREYADRAKFAKVNVDDEPELASRFAIMSIPTVMFFAHGKAVDAVIGAVSSAAYKKRIEETLKSA